MPDVDQIVELVRAETGAQLPTSRVLDLTRAMADGDRKRARRRTLGVVGAACATVVAVTAGFVALGKPVGVGLPPAGVVTSTPAQPDWSDPLRQRFTAGWLPSGSAHRLQRSTSSSMQTLTIAYPDVAYEPAGGQLTVQMFAVLTGSGHVDPAARRLGIADGGSPVGDPGPAVNGAASIWVRDVGKSRVALAWQWTAGGWVVVTGLAGSVTGHTADALRTTVVRVASQLDTDVASPVRLPFTVDAPAGLSVAQSLTTTGSDGGYEAQLVFTDGAGMLSTDGMPRGLVIGVERRTGGPTEPASNTTIDGHPAKVDFSEQSGRVDLFNVDGHTVTVFVYSAVSMGIDEAEAIALVRSVSLVDEPADLSSWTDSPLR